MKNVSYKRTKETKTMWMQSLQKQASEKQQQKTSGCLNILPHFEEPDKYCMTLFVVVVQ